MVNLRKENNTTPETHDPYERVCLLGGKESVELVLSKEDQQFYVRKTLFQYDLSIYETLQEQNIPGIPKIYSLTPFADRLVVIEEYIQGQSIYELIQERYFTPEEALAIFKKLQDILCSLHGMHPAIIHRDIKPGNVLLTSSQEVYLIDFNAARQYDAQKKEDTVILGTNGYASPEQYGFAQTDPRSDVYSMAILFCTMISGKTSPKDIDCKKSLKQVLLKATDLSPAMRYRNVQSFVSALQTSITTKWIQKVPGFRQGKRSHQIIAAGYYLGSVMSVFEKRVATNSLVKDLMLRVFTVWMFSIPVLMFFNIGNIQRFFPGTKHPNVVLRYCILYIYVSVLVSAPAMFYAFFIA